MKDLSSGKKVNKIKVHSSKQGRGEWLLGNSVSVEVDYTETEERRICELDKEIIENILIKVSRSHLSQFLMKWMNLEPLTQVKSERKISDINAHLWNLERWY